MSHLSPLDRLAQQHRPTQLDSPLATYDMRRGGTKLTKAAYVAEQQIAERARIEEFKKWMRAGPRKGHALKMTSPGGNKAICLIDDVHHKGNNSCELTVRSISDSSISKCYTHDNTQYGCNPSANAARLTIVYGESPTPEITTLMPRGTIVTVPGKLFMKNGDICVNGKYAFHVPEANSNYIEKVASITGHTTDGNYIVNMGGWSQILPPDWVFPLTSRIGSVIYSQQRDEYFYLIAVDGIVATIQDDDGVRHDTNAATIEFSGLQHTKVGDTIEIGNSYFTEETGHPVTVAKIDLDGRFLTTVCGHEFAWNDGKFLTPAMNNLGKIRMSHVMSGMTEILANRFSYVYGSQPLHLFEWHVTRNGVRTPYPSDIYTALELAHKYGGELEVVEIPRSEFIQRKNDYQNGRWQYNPRNPLCR